MGRAFDLDAEREAALADADTEPITFTFGNESFAVPHPRLWPLTVEASLAGGDLAAACIGLLDTTEGQVDRWVALKPTVADASALFRGINSATRVAADLGE
jgi:hypothetical protein